MTILHYHFTHGIMTFTTFVFERASATIEFIRPVIQIAIGWCFIAIKRFKSIDALLSG